MKLTLQTGPGGLRADGADVALVQVEVVDAAGRRCPTALNLVEFVLNGPAEWRGGIAQGPDNFILAPALPVECGVNRVLLRSLPQPGRIALAATSPGLAPAQIELTSTAVETTDGWPRTRPGENLPSRLDRGPTPTTPSFTVTRLAPGIVSASAGSNAADARFSFDDNEVTAWTSDDNLAAAWIEYRLERPATLSEATFKLNGFREHDYPMRILVDGREVYHGLPPHSLGYVTLPLGGAHGQTVRIELVAAGSTRDASGISELNDQRNAASATARLAARTLSIVEARFYESVTSAPQHLTCPRPSRHDPPRFPSRFAWAACCWFELRSRLAQSLRSHRDQHGRSTRIFRHSVSAACRPRIRCPIGRRRQRPSRSCLIGSSAIWSRRRPIKVIDRDTRQPVADLAHLPAHPGLRPHGFPAQHI